VALEAWHELLSLLLPGARAVNLLARPGNAAVLRSPKPHSTSSCVMRKMPATTVMLVEEARAANHRCARRGHRALAPRFAR
jgi:hypothetical protein